MEFPWQHKTNTQHRIADKKSSDDIANGLLEDNIIQYPSQPTHTEPRPRGDQVPFDMNRPPESRTPVVPVDEEERIIIEAVLHGDHVEFEILVRRYHKPIYHLMLRATRQVMTAEDLTQETFTRAYEKLYTFKQRKRFFPWLYTIAVNLCRDHLRRLGISNAIFSENNHDASLYETSHNTCAENPECALEKEQVAARLDRLPLQYSEPLLLYYREGFTVKEISGTLGISPAAVKVRIHRGREKLKQQLGVDYERI